jgi:hypothetical protein
VVLVGVALSTGRARADGTEPSYGRVAGDVTVVVGAGAVFDARGGRAEGEVRLRYLDSAGLFAAYEDAPVIGSSAPTARVLATGLELRPLFLFRWLRGQETHRAWMDLTLDSFGLELGATFQQPSGGTFGSQRGVAAGLGLEVPILPDATGPWIGIHGGLRWSEEALASGDVNSSGARTAYVAITLAWHQVVIAHVVDVGDEAPR